MFSSNTPRYYEVSVADDWGFYIDIEAHDWNQVGASAPIQIQVNPNTVENEGRKNSPITKEEVQRYIDMSSREEKNNGGIGCLNLNFKKTVTIAIIAICAFY